MAGVLNTIRQGALKLFGGSAGAFDKGVQAADTIVVRGPRGEYYTFPKETAKQFGKDSHALNSYLRRMIEEGQISPVLDMNTGEIPYKQVAKAQKAMDLAIKIRDRGLPTKSARNRPEFDAIALQLNAPGTRADAVAAMSGPSTTKDPSMFLHDLAAADAPGAGGSLLDSVLKGPLYDDASEVVLTPLPTAMDFYRKFGMEHLSPSEALSDTRIHGILDRLDEVRNAQTLGVGVIKRAKGGLTRMAQHCRDKGVVR